MIAVVPGYSIADAIERWVADPTDDTRADRLRAMAGVLAGASCQLSVPRVGQGRVSAFEIAVATSSVAALVLADRLSTLTPLLRLGQTIGMSSMDGALERLVVQGTVAYEAALPFAVDRQSFTRALGARG